ncbi:hypothetical protein GH714_022798 [Hevea brasiliensis]|uniref:Retroviral polymerase SH3-like domain-containing protein n=1 Tax=Hevea brasiliensis TaxID=3981 RepID=A0A6A6LZR1_HEVBR|nr:hypothetical protein GH714_022798 [Hevea brasiliensis]
MLRLRKDGTLCIGVLVKREDEQANLTETEEVEPALLLIENCELNVSKEEIYIEEPSLLMIETCEVTEGEVYVAATGGSLRKEGGTSILEPVITWQVSDKKCRGDDTISSLVSVKGVMIGYEEGSKAYRLYDPVKKKLIISRDVIFEEEKSWPWQSEKKEEELENVDIFTVKLRDAGGATTETENDVTVVGVYVDDLILTGSSATLIDKFKHEMKEGVRDERLGTPKLLLGNRGMSDCNSCRIPMDPRCKLSKHDEEPPVDATTYRSIIGSLRYLVNTRPDLAYSVGVVSRYMESPTTSHMNAVKQILRYVKGTLDLGIVYKKNQECEALIGYSDSDLGGDTDDRKSTTGILFFLGESPITWVSQKQRELLHFRHAKPSTLQQQEVHVKEYGLQR